MKKLSLSIAALFTCLGLAAQGPDGSGNRRDRLEKHVHFLAGDSMNGRAAGSSDAAKARKYIIGQYEGLDIRPFFDRWEMPFESGNGKKFCNVVGIIDGSDPVLKNEYIVLGAHYDHLGIKNGKIYNGADDNASGTAAIIEIARTLASCRENLERSVIIAAFDAEELGLFGSGALSKALADSVGIDKIKLMMSIDMVGWYRQSGHLILEGTGTIRNGEALAREEALKTGINIKTKQFEKSVLTATDTEGFAIKGVPTLAVTTGLKSPYHKPGDDPELIDYEGLDKVSGYISDLTAAAAGNPSFTASGKLAEKHTLNVKAFEIGLWAGLERSSARFTDARFRTDPRAGWSGGISAQFNSGCFGVRLGAEYGSLPCYFPDENDIYANGFKYSQHAFTTPLSIIIQTPGLNSVRGFAGVGGFYRRIVDSGFETGGPSYTVRPDQGGWQWLVGVKVGHFSLEVVNRFQIGTMFTGPDDPAARLNTSSLKLGIIF